MTFASCRQIKTEDAAFGRDQTSALKTSPFTRVAMERDALIYLLTVLHYSYMSQSESRCGHE